MKNEYLLIITSTFFYALLLSLFKWGYDFNGAWIAFILGGLLGAILLEIDHFLYVLYTKPDDPLSLEARNFLTEKHYRYFLNSVLLHREERIELVLHSGIFGLIILVLSVFTLTSTGSHIGSGLVLGLYLRYLLDAYDLYRRDPVRLNKVLFWQLKGIISLDHLKIFLLILLAGFMVSSTLFIR